jgi:bacillithiol synthase
VSATSDATESKVRIDLRRLPFIRPLAAEYASNFSAIAPLFAGDPQSPEAWRDTITRVQQHPRRTRELAVIIEAQQERRRAPRQAREAGAFLEDPQTVAVVTGQQAGLFGGPLYTFLKAITTIQVARRVEREHGVRAVPVFWVESEDHDWAEVRTITVLDHTQQPREITTPDVRGAGRLPVAQLVFDENVSGSIDELKAHLAPTAFTPWLETTLRDCYRPGTAAGEAFARFLETVLGPYGLVVFESSEPAAKPFVADLFARELQFPGRTASLASTAADTMRSRGHEPQVTTQADTIALFRANPERVAIKRDGDGFVAGDERFDAQTLIAEAVDHPERFSPNVLLRPVVQDALLPTICYVAGPSELAYLAQLRGVYEHFGVPMPLIYQRATATLVDPAAIRFLSRSGLAVEEFRAQDESTLNKLLQSLLPKDVEEALATAQRQVTQAMERVIEVIPAVDPTLAGAAKTTLGKMDHDLKNLNGKVIQAAKKKDETVRRQFTRTQTQLFPSGEPQERTLGVPFFLNRYGPALIDRLLVELPVEMGAHWLIAI